MINKLLYSIISLLLLFVPVSVSCMELAVNNPPVVASTSGEKTYTLVSKADKKSPSAEFTVSDAFIKKCNVYTVNLSHQNISTDMSSQAQEFYTSYIPSQIGVPASKKALEVIISLVNKIPVTDELSKEVSDYLAGELNRKSFDELLQVTPALDFLQVKHILPILYKALETKLHEPTLKARLCNDAIYAQHLFANELHEDLRAKVSNKTQAKNNLLELAAIQSTTLPSRTYVVVALQLSKDGNYLFSASTDHTIKIWDITDPTNPVLVKTLTAHDRWVTALKISKDGKYLFSGSFDNTIKIWDITDPANTVLINTLTGHTDWITALQCSKDGKYLFSTFYNNTIKIWNISDPTNAVLVKTLTSRISRVTTLQLSKDGEYLFSGFANGTIRIWNIANPANPVLINTLIDHTNRVNAFQFSKDGNYLFSASYDNTIKIWHITDPANTILIATLMGHTDWITALQLSKDGNYLFSASADNTIKIWDITDPTTMVLIKTLAGHTQLINALQLSKDGNYLFSTSNDNTIKIWDVEVLSYSVNNLLLEHDYIIDCAVQAKRANTKLDFTTEAQEHLLEWYASMPEQWQKIVECSIKENTKLLAGQYQSLKKDE